MTNNYAYSYSNKSTPGNSTFRSVRVNDRVHIERCSGHSTHYRRAAAGRINNKPVITLLVTFIISLVIVLSMQFVNVNANRAEGTTLKRQYFNIEIMPGDTLTSIANEYMGAGYSSVNDYIEDIKELNSMKTSTIYSGQSLIIPQYVAVEE